MGTNALSTMVENCRNETNIAETTLDDTSIGLRLIKFTLLYYVHNISIYSVCCGFVAAWLLCAVVYEFDMTLSRFIINCILGVIIGLLFGIINVMPKTVKLYQYLVYDSRDPGVRLMRDTEYVYYLGHIYDKYRFKMIFYYLTHLSSIRLSSIRNYLDLLEDLHFIVILNTMLMTNRGL